MSAWQLMETLPDAPADFDTKVFKALLWGRLHVRGTHSNWITEWKVLKAAWVHWTGQSINRSARDASTWYVTGSEPAAQITRVEATHWMPLPDPPV